MRPEAIGWLRRRVPLIALALVMFMVGCGGSDTTEPPLAETGLDSEARPAGLSDWPQDPSCGSYVNENVPPAEVSGQAGANECLLEAFRAGEPAELKATFATVEGDPIVNYLRVLGPGRVEVFIDASADRFGPGGWIHQLCGRLDEEQGFLRPGDCRGLSLDAVVDTTDPSGTSTGTTEATDSANGVVPPPTEPTPPPEVVSTRSDPLEGWGRLDAVTEVFGGSSIVDAALEGGGRTVLVGCDGDTGGEFPAWWAEGAFDFARARGPEGVSCLRQVEATPVGWLAVGAGPALWSASGESWEALDLFDELGFEQSGQLGSAQAIFVSPTQDRVTLLFSRAAEAETTIATLVTTTDGVTWTAGPPESAAPFDSSTISVVVAGGAGLLAAGASPGGQFVPTAAVFTSADGLDWRRVTPEGGPDYDDKVISGLMLVGDRYIAVGGDFFENGLMTAWSSPDGLAWTRLPHPDEATDPAVAQMTAEAVTVAEGYIWVSGRDFDARRDDPQTLPALWRSAEGQEWERIDLDELEVNIPFELASSSDFRLGVWPPPYSLVDEPTLLFGSD